MAGSGRACGTGDSEGVKEVDAMAVVFAREGEGGRVGAVDSPPASGFRDRPAGRGRERERCGRGRGVHAISSRARDCF